MKRMLSFLLSSMLMAFSHANNLETLIFEESGTNNIVIQLPDTFVLIGTEVSVPLILPAKEHIRVQNINGVWQVSSISAATFDSLQLSPSYGYSLYQANIDGDGKKDLVLLGTGVSGGISSFVITRIDSSPLVQLLPDGIVGSAGSLSIVDSDGNGRDELYFNSQIVISTFTDVPAYAQTPKGFDGLFDESSILLSDYSVGEIPSSFSVNQGMFSFNMPIANLPAPNAAVPSISVVYSNSSYEGELGQGFSLSAGGAITRCPSTIPIDGGYKPVSLTDEDQLCLNGQRLVLSSGTHLRSGAVYQTEMESYAKITAHGSENGVPQYFTVWSKDGRQSIYGELNPSTKALEISTHSVINKQATIAWHLAQETDLSANGNKIEYFYSRDKATGLHNLSFVQYGLSNKTRIEYVDKPNSVAGYYLGYNTAPAKQIETIVVEDRAGTLFREYKFSFFQDEGKNYLEKIDLCTVNTCLPPTSFNWSANKEQKGTFVSGALDSLAQYAKKNSDNPITLLVYDDWEVYRPDDQYEAQDEYQIVDFNADGLQDFIFMPAVKDAETWILINNGEGFEEPYSISSELSYGSGPTLNGHAFTQALLSDRNDRDYCVDCTADVRQFADVNGDGYPDAIVITNLGIFDRSGIYVGLNVEVDGKRVISKPTRWSSEIFPLAATVYSNPEEVYDYYGRYVRTKYNESSYSGYPTNGFFNRQSYTAFMDMNNDSLADFVGINSVGITILYSDGKGSFVNRYQSGLYADSTPELVKGFSTNYETSPYRDSSDQIDPYVDIYYPIRFGDVNGDGQIDLVYWGDSYVFVSLNPGDGKFAGFIPWIVQSSRKASVKEYVEQDGQTISVRASEIHELADVNGDGLADLIRITRDGVKVALSNGQRFIGLESEDIYIHPVDGQKLHVDSPIWNTHFTYTNPPAIYDANGDGKADLVKGQDVAFSTGTSFSALTKNYVPFEYQMAMDINGDGQNDEVKWDSETSTLSWSIAEAAPDYLIQAIHYGTGRKTLINYATQTGVHFNVAEQNGELVYSLAKDETVYTKTAYQAPATSAYDSAPGAHLSKAKLDAYTIATADGESEDYAYPLRISRSSGLVVASVSESNGLGDYNKQSYRYKDQVLHLLGRGVQGYKEISVTNEDAQITTVNEFDLHFPISGAIARTATIAPNGRVVNEELSKVKGLKTSHGTWLTRTLENTSNSFDLTTGNHLNSIVTKNTEFSDYNDVKKTTAVIYDMTGSGHSYTTESVNTYENKLTSTQDYWIGKLKTAKVTKWDTVNGDADKSVKQASFDYYDNGLMQFEISEPGSPYQVKTEYVYDDWGNRTETRVTAKNRISEHPTKAHLSLGLTIADVTRTTVNVMDDQGLYLKEKRNDLYAVWGNKPTIEYLEYSECGLPKKTRNILGYESMVEYDDFCNQIATTSPANIDINGNPITVTQTQTKEWVVASDIHAPQGALIKTTVAQQEAGKAPVVSYSDLLGRNIRSVSKSFNGSDVYVDTVYNNEGHLAKVSRPYFPGDTQFWIENEVDDLGRVVKNTMPGPIGGRAITETAYNGFTTITTDNEGHSKTTTVDAQGNLKKVTEPLGAYIEYAFDSAGRLREMDANGQAVSYTYDQMGRQSSLFESNQGTKYFEYNGFGQPIWQTDSSGNIVEMVYDNVGRLIKRYESADGSTYTLTQWHYNNSGNGIGQIASVENTEGYLETKAYDALGRAEATQTSVDGETFTTGVTFDDLGRVYSATNNGFETFNTFNEQGYHESIKALNDPAQIEASYAKLEELKQKAIDEAQAAIDLATYYEQQEALYRNYAAQVEAANTNTISAELQAELDASYELFSKANEVADYLAADYASLAEKLVSLAEQIEYQSFRPQIAQNLMSYYDEMGADSNMVTLWKALHRDAGNRLTSFVSGNGVLNTRTYDPGTAQLKTIEAGFGIIPDDILRLEYTYDRVNNVTSRVDYNLNMRETFDYDALDRMSTSTVEHLATGTSNATSYNYDANGNITFKTGIGSYSYGSNERTTAEAFAGPNAVTSANGFSDYSYDENGNMLTGGGRTITWTSFNKPKTISKGETTLEFWYTPGHARYKQTNGASTKYYHGKAFEKEISVKDGIETTNKKYFLYANGELIGTKIDTEEKPVAGGTTTAITQMRYMHQDALGSISAITDANGQVIDRLSFDPHGKRRLFDWRAADPNAGLLVELKTDNTRGYTGHEHLDDVGLIHMNGRLYDPAIGRFISADPTLQFPTNTQNHNRYSYVGNNPMKYVDKDGYGWFKKLIKKAKKTVKTVVSAATKVVRAVGKAVKKAADWTKNAAEYVWEKSKPILKNMAVMAVATVLSVGNPVLAGMIAGGINAALVPGASLGDIIRGAVIGGVSASFSFTIGHGINWSSLGTVGGHVAKAAAHGVAQGTTSVMRGGSFKDGMIGGFMGSVAPVAGIGGDNLGGALARTAVAGTVGGITAELTGGDFEDGFETAAFTQLFNDHGLDLKRHAQDYVSNQMAVIQNAFENAVGKIKDAFSPPPYSYGTYTGATAISPAGGVNAGVNGQFFSNGDSNSFAVVGVGWGYDLGAGGEANAAIYLGDGDGGQETWSGRFDSYHLSFAGYTANYFYGGGWYGLSFGGATDGIGASTQINNYIPLLDDD